MLRFGERVSGTVENNKDTRSDYVLGLITKFGGDDGLVRHVREKIGEFVKLNEDFEFSDEKFLRFVFDDCPEDISRHDLDILASFAKDATSEENITNPDRRTVSGESGVNVDNRALQKAWGHQIRQPEDTYK